MAKSWPTAGRARTSAADFIEGLSPEQQQTTTLCDQWDAKGVLAHMVAFVDISLPSFMLAIAKNKGDFDQAAIAMAAPYQERSVSELANLLRERADKTSPLPIFPEMMTLADVVIHTQDVRRPLGLTTEADPEMIRHAITFVTENSKAKILNGRPTPSLSYRATDTDWSYGSGPEVAGTEEAILMALANRDVLDELNGDGVDQLRA